MEIILIPILAFSSAIFGIFGDNGVAELSLVVLISLAGWKILEILVARSAAQKGVFSLLLGAVVLLITYGSLVVIAENNVYLYRDMEFVKLIAKLAIVPTAFLVGFAADFKRPLLRTAIAVVASSLLVFLTIMHARNHFVTGKVFMALHSNNLGITAVFAAFYGMMFYVGQGSRVYARVLLVVAIPAVVLSVSRGSLVCLILIWLVFAVLRFAKFSFAVKMGIFPVVICASLFFTFTWSEFTETRLFENFNRFSISLIDKPLDTGRARMWEMARADFDRNPWFGSGTRAHESWTRRLPNGKVIKLSVHNYYWAILQEAGIFGLAAVLAYFWLIWSIIASFSDNIFGDLGLALFASILSQATVEVQLSTGSFVIAISIWIALGAAASLANQAQQAERTNYTFA